MPSFSVASGQVLAAGRYYDTANVGNVLGVSRNNFVAVDHDVQLGAPYERWWNGYGFGRSSVNMYGSWGGTVFFPNLGAKGSMVIGGGGHGANQGLFFYRYDYDTNLWSRIGAPGNLPADFLWTGFSNASGLATYNAANDLRDPAWNDYSFNGGKIKLQDHSYNTYWPYFDGVTNWLIIPGSPLSQSPSGTQLAPHAVNMTTGVALRALATLPGTTWPDDNGKVCVVDTIRKKTWVFRQGSTTTYFFDMSAGLPFTFGTYQILNTGGAVTSTFIAGYATAWEYAPEADAMVCVASGGGVNAAASFYIFSMATGVPVSLERTGLPTTTFAHGGYAPSMTWVPGQQAFYLYEGFNDDYCTVLRPSTLNFATCSWAWSRERFAGAAPVARQSGVAAGTEIQASYRSMHFVPALGCLAWHNGPGPTSLCLDGLTHDGAVQLFRPKGRVI